MTTPVVSRIGAVVDAVVALARTIDDGLQVADGITVGVPQSRALCIGFTDSPDRPGYTTSWERQEGYGARLQEDFTIQCFLTLTTGDHDDGAAKRLRDDATALLGALDGALRAARGRDAVWERAGLSGAAEWVAAILPEGSICNVRFDVVGTALL